MEQMPSRKPRKTAGRGDNFPWPAINTAFYFIILKLLPIFRKAMGKPRLRILHDLYQKSQHPAIQDADSFRQFNIEMFLFFILPDRSFQKCFCFLLFRAGFPKCSRFYSSDRSFPKCSRFYSSGQVISEMLLFYSSGQVISEMLLFYSSGQVISEMLLFFLFQGLF